MNDAVNRILKIFKINGDEAESAPDSSMDNGGSESNKNEPSPREKARRKREMETEFEFEFPKYDEEEEFENEFPPRSKLLDDADLSKSKSMDSDEGQDDEPVKKSPRRRGIFGKGPSGKSIVDIMIGMRKGGAG